MANPADYDIVTFQRLPELWRASVTRKNAWSRTQGHALLSFVTSQDSESEAAAAAAALTAIKNLTP